LPSTRILSIHTHRTFQSHAPHTPRLRQRSRHRSWPRRLSRPWHRSRPWSRQRSRPPTPPRHHLQHRHPNSHTTSPNLHAIQPRPHILLRPTIPPHTAQHTRLHHPQSRPTHRPPSLRHRRGPANAWRPSARRESKVTRWKGGSGAEDC
jgi:hypothetical protein